MAYLHKLNPYAIEFSEGIGVRWYGLAYLTGFLIGYWIICFLSRNKLSPLKEEEIGDFAFSLAIGTIVGGRLGYCLFYAPELFLQFNHHFPFWGLLAINQGGMASHGGIAGIAITCILYARKHHLSLLHLGDLSTFGGTIGIFFGRIANFVNGELVGRPCSPTLPWAVKFPQDILAWPNQAPEKLPELVTAVQQLGVAPERWQTLVQNAQVDAHSWSVLQGYLYSLLDAIQKGNVIVQQAVEPLLVTRHPSQLYGSLLEGLAVFVILAIIWLKPRKPGVVAGWFFVTYSIMRIFTELFRVPDAQIGFQWLGLTRGQWLSVVILGIGLVCLCWWARRDAEKIGGWGVVFKGKNSSGGTSPEAAVS
jgi:phosphatidylglycerol:prolipoprotein diacylglycerol transferase